MITINGQKMGKSLGNFITLEELFTGSHQILEKAYSPMAIRFFIMQAHYRSTLDFSNEALTAAEKGYKKMVQAAKDVASLNASQGALSAEIADIKRGVYDALCDDLNTSVALAHLFEAVRVVNLAKDNQLKLTTEDKETLQFLFSEIMEGVLGIVDEQSGSGSSVILNEVVGMILEMRKEAKAEKNFAKSDAIRQRLTEIGITIKDTKEGTEWSL